MPADTRNQDPQQQDPKALWLDQDTEDDLVTLEQIHALGRKIDRRARYMPAAFGLGLIIAGFALGAVWITAHDPLRRAVAVLSGLGVLGTYAMIYRLELPSRDPAEPISAYLRRRLQRKLAYRQGGWLLALAPVVPAMLLAGYVTFHRDHAPLPAKILPFLVLAASLAFVAIRNRLRIGQTRAELEELDALLKR